MVEGFAVFGRVVEGVLLEEVVLFVISLWLVVVEGVLSWCVGCDGNTYCETGEGVSCLLEFFFVFAFLLLSVFLLWIQFSLIHR